MKNETTERMIRDGKAMMGEPDVVVGEDKTKIILITGASGFSTTAAILSMMEEKRLTDYVVVGLEKDELRGLSPDILICNDDIVPDTRKVLFSGCGHTSLSDAIAKSLNACYPDDKKYSEHKHKLPCHWQSKERW